MIVARNVKPTFRQIRGEFGAYLKFCRGLENLNYQYLGIIWIMAKFTTPLNLTHPYP